jgi:hypothetical protein
MDALKDTLRDSVRPLWSLVLEFYAFTVSARGWTILAVDEPIGRTAEPVRFHDAVTRYCRIIRRLRGIEPPHPSAPSSKRLINRIIAYLSSRRCSVRTRSRHVHGKVGTSTSWDSRGFACCSPPPSAPSHFQPVRGNVAGSIGHRPCAQQWNRRPHPLVGRHVDMAHGRKASMGIGSEGSTVPSDCRHCVANQVVFRRRLHRWCERPGSGSHRAHALRNIRFHRALYGR